MNREQIIDAFVKDGEYRVMCRKVAGADADDLYQELVLYVLEIPEPKLARLNETCLKCFFYRMAVKQYQSRNSAFYRKYKRERSMLAQVDGERLADMLYDETADPLPAVERAIDELAQGPAWADVAVLRLCAEAGAQKEVAKATGIPVKTVSNMVNSARKLITKKVKKYG